MNYTKFWKTLINVIIYLLVAGGAVVMILPFAWMIMTSLKTDGEVNNWPPTWTSKNFGSTRDINLAKGSSTISNKSVLSLTEFKSLTSNSIYNPNKLVYYVNDDKVRRGEITLNYDKINFADSEDLNVLLEEFYKYFDNSDVRKDINLFFIDRDATPENFEKLYFGLFSPETGYYKKTNMVKNIILDLNKMSKFIDLTLEKNINRLPYFRINDSYDQNRINEINDKKQEFENYLKVLRTEINKTINEIEIYSKGLGLISIEENEKILNLLMDFNTNIKTFQDSILSKSNMLISKNIYEPNIQNINTLNMYSYFISNYENIQNKKLDNLKITFKVPLKEDMYNNFVEDIKKSDFSEEFKTEVLKLSSKKNILELKELVIQHFETKIIENIKSDFINEPKDLSRFISILRTLSKNNANINNYAEYITKSEFEFINSKISDKQNEFESLLNLRISTDNELNKFTKFYSNSISRVELLETSEIIDKILYKENSNIEIYTNNIYSSWLIDEMPIAKANFTFGEKFKNIFQNYVDAWNAAPFSKYYMNTVLMATATTVLEIIIGSMAAFAFAKLNFFGKNFIFTLFLATMMVPGEVMLVPNYITISRFQWIDSYYALIVPWVVSVFAIFLLRQQFLTVPNELWDAAKIDGSSSWRFLWTVMVPLSKPSILTGALLKFVGSWNAFLWVLIVTKSPEMRTLAVGLQTFRSESGEIYNLLMSASTFSLIPVILLFILLQNYFVEGIAKSGLKG